RQDKTSKAYRIMTTDEYQRDMVVYREDTTRVFNLLHPNPVIVATAIRDIFPNRVVMTLGVTDTTTMNGTGVGGAAGVASATAGAVAGVRQATTRQTRNATVAVGAGGIGAFGIERQSEQLVREKKTPDQLAKLEAVSKLQDSGQISSDELSKISGSEQRIYLTVNREHNLIIVRSSDNSAIKEIERLIKEMDKPTPQVLLEMKILALDVGDSYRQSFDVDFITGKTTYGPQTDQRRNPLGTPAPEEISTTRTYTSPTGVVPQTTSTSTQTGTLVSAAKNILGLGNFGLEGGTFVYQFMNDNIRARLQLLAENHHINTLSSPILMASNNKPAKVFVGVEQVITTGFEASGGAVTGTTVVPTSIVPVTEVRNIGNTLQIMPKINADRSVTLMIQQDSSSVVVGGASIPIPVGATTQYFNVDTVKTSNIEGTVVAKDGLTVAIGGLIDSSSSTSVQKVPLLGDIPVFGELFQRKVESKSKRELILLITPHIITAPGDVEEVSRDTVESISAQEW
ncbi:partial Secretin OutD, partial [Anaerolineae bacterium]